MPRKTLVVVLLVSSTAHAQEVEAIPPGPDKIKPVKKDEAVPYSGMLYDYDTALRWGNWLRQYKLRLKADVAAEKKICSIKLRAAVKSEDLRLKAYTKLNEDLRARILKVEKNNVKLSDELQNPPWYRSTWFGVGVGVVGTVVVAGAGVWAVNSVK